MEFLISDQISHLFMIPVLNTTLKQFIYNREHFIPCKRTAFQKNLTYRQYLTVGETLFLTPSQNIAMFCPIIYQFPVGFGILRK